MDVDPAPASRFQDFLFENLTVGRDDKQVRLPILELSHTVRSIDALRLIHRHTLSDGQLFEARADLAGRAALLAGVPIGLRHQSHDLDVRRCEQRLEGRPGEGAGPHHHDPRSIGHKHPRLKRLYRHGTASAGLLH